ncbi:hypothetical protein NDU88_003457 [Pleurodeles waltl]|uniref:Uncharacterized protein n=1 Tax=Pleurodeles waltl TaxID=8319 RepID=A0AAV7UDD1_PLEWA|nr:hypothetical protein NDU88_003457 [Pleurodeles waltl]
MIEPLKRQGIQATKVQPAKFKVLLEVASTELAAPGGCDDRLFSGPPAACRVVIRRSGRAEHRVAVVLGRR